MRRRNDNRQMGGRQRAQRRDGSCRFNGPGRRMNGGSGRGICMNMENSGDNKEFLTKQKEFLEQRIDCVNEQLENLE